jgi:hypothetical protein
MKDILILSDNNYLMLEAIIKFFKSRQDIRFRLLSSNEENLIGKYAKKYKKKAKVNFHFGLMINFPQANARMR